MNNIFEMSEKQIAIKMQKQGYGYMVLPPGEDALYTKTVREAGDIVKRDYRNTKGIRVHKITDYLQGKTESIDVSKKSYLSEGSGTLQLVPAYGRDYKSKKEVEAAWKAGKDFQINDIMSPDDGRYINLQDAEADKDLKSVYIRYKRLAQVALIKVH